MHHSRWLETLLMLLLGCVLMAVTAACSRVPAEQAVRQQLQALQSAIDARDAGAVHDLLAEDFVGNRGMDRRQARQLSIAVFLQHRDVGAHLGPVTVQLHGQTEATATFSVLATGGTGGLLPESGQVFEVETSWRLVDGEWRLLNAHWTPELE